VETVSWSTQEAVTTLEMVDAWTRAGVAEVVGARWVDPGRGAQSGNGRWAGPGGVDGGRRARWGGDPGGVFRGGNGRWGDPGGAASGGKGRWVEGGGARVVDGLLPIRHFADSVRRRNNSA
jgi:hypothetical protein